MNLWKGEGSYKLVAFEDCPAFYTSRPPSWFHRLMQRWLLGFKWSQIGKNRTQ